MPEAKKYKSFELLVADIGSTARYPYDGEQLVITDPGREYISWEILRPQPQKAYRIYWKW
jgi:hypothetical protein